MGRAIVASGNVLIDEVKTGSDVIVFLNWDKSSKKTLRKAKTLGAVCVLSITEPTPVIPSHGDLRFRSTFDGIVEFGRAHTTKRVCLPSAWEPRYFSRTNRLNKVVAVSGNKFSFVPGELYSLRLRAYSQVEGLEVFGSGWQTTWLEDFVVMAKELIVALFGKLGLTPKCTLRLLPHMRFRFDPVQDKLRTISDYQFCLVIENSAEYVSEKLIDSILAGALPVYVGGLPNYFGVPEDLYVKSGPSLKDIEAALKIAKSMDYEAWRRRAQEWINDGRNRDMRSRASANRAILSTIKEAFENRKLDSQ